MTRRNLLLSRSYLAVRKTATSDIPIEDSLIEMGYKVFCEYQKAMLEKCKEEEKAAPKLRVKEEQERMKVMPKRDKERKTELDRIKAQEDVLAKKKKEVESKTLEAERLMQQAIEAMREATKENMAENLTFCSMERDKVERNAMEKAANRILLEPGQVKWKAEMTVMSSLPTIPKKN